MDRIEKFGLKIDAGLHRFLVEEAMPGTGIDAEHFFEQLSALVHDLAPKNRALLAKRDELQAKLDAWYRQNGAPSDIETYQAFLRDIGYLLSEGGDFSVSTANVDPEIATIAGPQLVVPVMNARYALNAANARWGSLYDALYGTDAISDADGAEKGRGYNPKRGAKVIAWARDFLDASAPLAKGNWADVTSLKVAGGALEIGLKGGSAPRSSPGHATSSMPAPRWRRVTGPTSPRSRLRVARWRLALRTARTRRCATPLNSPAIPAPKARGRRSFSGTIICMRSSSSTPPRRSARRTRPVSRTSSSNRRSPRSWIAKIRSRPSMPKTRSSSTATGSA